MTSQMPWGGAGAVGQRGTCWPHSAGGAGPARSCASGAVMRAQCVSRRLRAVWRAKLVEEELLAHAAVEKCKAVARESLMKDAQKLRAERTAARKEKLKQEKQLVAQLEQQLQAETEEMEVLRQENSTCKRSGRSWSWRVPGEWDWASAAPGAATGLQCCWAWGLGFSWAHGVTEQPDPSPGVLYAQHYDQELLYRLLLRVLPQAMYASPAYFASRSLRVVCDGLLPI
eukprot:XP_025002180.1 uncharacterized protein LOC112531380 [Gallus gallus]